MAMSDEYPNDMRRTRERFNPFSKAFSNPPQVFNPPPPPEALEALIARKNANDATSKATDQYEADVADFKNTEATELEQGIAALPISPAVNNSPQNVEETFNPYDFITRSDNNYMSENYTIGPQPGQPYFGPGNYSFDDVGNYPLSPYHPDYVPYAAPTMPDIMYPTTLPGGAPFPPGHPNYVPGGEDLEPAPPPNTNPRNPYTGAPMRNPYQPYQSSQPYSTDSGAEPLMKRINPEDFGNAPVFRPNDNLQPLPSPTAAAGGGYLNKGISQLPMNGQGDTLTTQVFQSGFRPRR
jgi:hypothetical protein|tara:strand:- start:495 stop:1379 length:885 start_codon:yes stop_codon:yes gene_type:complete